MIERLEMSRKKLNWQNRSNISFNFENFYNNYLKDLPSRIVFEAKRDSGKTDLLWLATLATATFRLRSV